jgi:hypothetical protein
MGPLSGDLRKRVVSAVHEEGMSCRAAARRFGRCVSAAATRRCQWAATRVHSASRRTRIFFLAFIGATLTLRSTKSATVWSLGEVRRCRRR